MSKKLEEVKARFMSGDKIKHELCGIVLEHPHLESPDTRFDEGGPYKVNALIPDTMANNMEELGFNVKEKDDGQKYVICKRKAHLGRPPVTAETGGVIEPGIIGNGSVATVKVTTYKVVVSGKTYLPLYLDAVVVSELVEFTGGGGHESLI